MPLKAILIVSLLASACHHHQSGLTYAYIRPDQLVLNGISLDLPAAQVRAILGEPLKIVDWPAKDGGRGPSTDWRFAQVTVELRKERVTAVWCFQQKCSTADGLAIGDSVSAMTALYGSSGTIYSDLTLGATFYKATGRDKCSLRVDHEHEIVIALRLGCP